MLWPTEVGSFCFAGSSCLRSHYGPHVSMIESGRRSGELHTIIVVIVMHAPYSDLHLSSAGRSSSILQHEKVHPSIQDADTPNKSTRLDKLI
jgi:hypothetical protein